MKQEPTSQRPDMPGGYLGTKLLAWSWADVGLAESRNYWVTSVTPKGRPHARPVWGVWLDGRLYFSSGSRIRSNLERGSAIEVQAFPDKGGTALTLHVADLGDVTNVLAGYDNLRGGETTGVGRIVPGGYDLDFQVRDMTILRVPGAAQLVATDGAIFFSRVEAPMRIRGSEVTLGEVVATGPSVGMTARGIMDTRTRTLDVVGVVTPAYVLNAAFGGLLGSREGEGLFGITYKASGPFTDPDIEINPLSIAAPGVLRRLFEPRTPTYGSP